MVELAERLRRAAQAAEAAQLDALLITPGADLQYLLGLPADYPSFERLTCLVLRGSGDRVLVAPQFERAGFAGLGLDSLSVEVAGWVDGENPYELVRSLLPDGARSVAVADAMPAVHAHRLRDAMPGVRQGLASPVLRELRMRKDAAEVDALRRAGQAIDRVHARMAELAAPGRTEAEVGAAVAAANVEEGPRRAGVTLIGSGPNSASPHHDVSERVLGAGDVVVVDIGGVLTEGYYSDCTRTYCVGEPTGEVAEVYTVLQEAQRAAVAAARPGVTAQSVDSTARTIIADAGFGEFFTHRTGHGIGLEVHEDPYIVAGNEQVLEPGMAFSVEPGIYLPGRWGARIEDIVVVTADGCEPLNRRPHELVSLQ